MFETWTHIHHDQTPPNPNCTLPHQTIEINDSQVNGEYSDQNRQN